MDRGLPLLRQRGVGIDALPPFRWGECFFGQDTIYTAGYKDGRYDQSRDGISLLFDEHSGVLSAQSRNRGTTLKIWQIALPQTEFENVISITAPVCAILPQYM